MVVCQADYKMNTSIIIPTIDNRGEIIIRTLKYYENSNFEIIVVDSGDLKNNKLESLKITYLHLPKKNFFDKLEIGIKAATNKYAVICQDDDFILEDSLILGSKFLDNNLDFSAVHGNYIFFEKIFEKIFYELGYTSNTRKSFDSEDLLLRLETFLKISPLLVSALTYKEVLLQNIRFVKKYHFISLFELTTLIFISLNGKLKYIDKCWQMRDMKIHNKLSLEKRKKPKKELIENLSSFLMTQKGINFLNDLNNEIKRKSGSNKEYTEELKNYAISIKKNKSKKELFKDYLIKYFPSLFKFLKKMNLYLRYIKKFSVNKINKLYMPEKNDLKKIENLILKFK